MAFKTYRDVNTGKFAEYPEDVGALFYDTLQEVDPDTLECIDCAKHQVEVIPLEDPQVSVLDTDYDKSKDKK